MRLTRRRTWVADQDPRPEGVGILRAVSAAARAPDDVTPPARSLVRIGAKLAARASARSDWALEPGLPLVRAWIISHQYLAGGTVHRFTRQPFAPSRFPNPQDRPATSHSFLCRSCNAIFNSYQPSDGTAARAEARRLWAENAEHEVKPRHFTGAIGRIRRAVATTGSCVGAACTDPHSTPVPNSCKSPSQ
jgi:hypothetical protein